MENHIRSATQVYHLGYMDDDRFSREKFIEELNKYNSGDVDNALHLLRADILKQRNGWTDAQQAWMYA